MSTCSRCQSEFSCGMTDDAERAAPCWCTTLPSLPPERYGAAGCYCPRCLAELVAQAEADQAAERAADQQPIR